jgi:uncharacterized protein (TIGR02453 family)
MLSHINCRVVSTNVEFIPKFVKDLFITSKKMRTLPSETLDFLTDLTKNNNKIWFDEHRARYEKIKKDLKSYFNTIFDDLKKSDNLEEMHIFRINRDIRFSKDQTPYTNHFSLHFTRRKPKLRGGYYLHIEPNNKSFLAGGFWDPNKEDTLRIRKEFEMDARPMREIMSEKQFYETFGNICGDKLSTAPKGFDKNHENIDLIRHKNWYFETHFTDEQILAQNFNQIVLKSFHLLKPYFDYMSDVLSTDSNGEPIF